MEFRLDKSVDGLIGKILVKVSFGFVTDLEKAEEQGERYMPLPAKIIRASIGVTESDRDPCIWFEFESNDDENDNFYAYANETITLEEG